MSLHRALMAVVLGLGVAVGGWAKGALSAGGALAASVVGAATFGFGGLPAGAALVAFFVSGSWLSRRAAVAGEVASAKGHRRDALQVVANGGVAALAAVASGLGFGLADGAVLGALAAAAADTWASEIGVRSRAPPTSIASGKPVSPGTSGGVTSLGWLAAGLGGLFVGLVYAATARGRFGWRQPVLVALAAGLIGSLGDSIGGATVQAAYRCPACGALVESSRRHCRDAMQPATLVRGARWVTNDAVNLIATCIGGLIGAVGWSGQDHATLEGVSSRRGWPDRMWRPRRCRRST